MRRAVNSPFRITNPFSKSHPAHDYAKSWAAIAISGRKQKIYATEDGQVKHYYDKTCGKKLWFMIDGKHIDTHCHLSEYKTANGAKVKEGALIAISGDSGTPAPSTGLSKYVIHVHHVRYDKNGNKIDYEKVLKEQENEVWYREYEKYQDYKADLIFIYGKYPSGSYTKWKEKYNKWKTRSYLRQVAKTQYGNLQKVKALLKEAQNKPPETIVKEVEKIVTKIEKVEVVQPLRWYEKILRSIFK